METHPRTPLWYRAAGTVLAPWGVHWGQRGEADAIDGRRGVRGQPADTWLHVASVGEAAGVLPFLPRLRSHAPDRSVHLSSLTPSGRAALASAFPQTSLAAPPFDAPAPVRRALDRVAPLHLVWFETEIWPQWLTEAISRGIRTAYVNARLSDRNWKRYHSLGGWLRGPLSRVDAVAAQTELDAERWAELGVRPEAIRTTGNTKFDREDDGSIRVLDAAERRAARRELGIDIDATWMLWTSLRPGEERWVERVSEGLADTPVRLLLVPRHPDRWSRSRWSHSSGRVHWLGQIGVQRLACRAADLAVVGGTLEGYGGHNPVEPASVGTPTLLGASVANCREAAGALLTTGGGVRVEDPEALVAAARRWIVDAGARADASRAAVEAVRQLRGAAERTLEWLAERGFWSA